MNLSGKRILLTGGAGFLGEYVTEQLKKRNISDIIVPRSIRFDLRKREVCEKVVKGIDVVIHLAAQIGGIGYISEHSGEMFYNNLIMGVELMEASRKANVKKFISIGTVCEYPKIVPLPFREKDLWNGYPDETTAPYGWAKKMLIVQGENYKRQYGFNAIHLLPVNLYGPGDNFDRTSSHVVPALIKKVIDSKAKKSSSVEVWGSGKATREFLYVEDAAEGIVLASENYDSTEPVNLGSGIETSVEELTMLIMKIIGYKGSIKWNTSKPDGQLKRQLDTSKAREFGFQAKTALQDGLKKTIDWYKKEYEKLP